VPAFEGRRQYAERDRRHRGHLELSRLEPERAACIARRALGVRDRARCLGHEGAAGCGQPNALGQALEQRPAELLLEVLDLLRQGRLGDEKPLGRPS